MDSEPESDVPEPDKTPELIITTKRNIISTEDGVSSCTQKYAQAHHLWICPCCETLNPQENRRCQACGQKR